MTQEEVFKYFEDTDIGFNKLQNGKYVGGPNGSDFFILTDTYIKLEQPKIKFKFNKKTVEDLDKFAKRYIGTSYE